ncbi:MAG TPA: hypothetical protein VN686_04270, partial [Gaiellales bacterium]|nr:hypothetical protein [Gaiellales bacterium]
ALPAGGATVAAAVAVFALLEAAAELGLVRLPLPQMRRQVPERWRERYPQPLTALLYGAGLGFGFATYLPVATLPVVAVAVAALAGPASGAAVLAAFGLGRGVALAVATARVRSHEQATARIEWMARLAGRRRLRLANAAALGLLGSVLAMGVASGVAQASGKIDLGTQPVADPSAGTGVLAFDRINSDGSLTGVVRYNGTFTDLPGMTPDVSGTSVVVDTGPAFEILDYTTMTVLQTLPLMGRDPALSGRWLVYRRLKNGRRQIVLYNLDTGSARVIAHSRLRTDLGPPDISYPRVVYHRTTAGSSSITVYRIDRKSLRSPRTTRIDSYFNPSIDGTSVVYVRQTLQGMQVEVLNLKTSRSRAIFSVNKGSGRFLWTTAIFAGRRYFTVYDSTTSSIHRG